MLTDRDRLAAELQAIVQMAAEPHRACENATSAIARAATLLGLTYRRARSLWYGHTYQVRVTQEEAERLRAEADRLRLLKLERLERDIAQLRALLAARHYAAGQAEAGGRVHLDDGAAAGDSEAAAPLMWCGWVL